MLKKYLLKEWIPVPWCGSRVILALSPTTPSLGPKSQPSPTSAQHVLHFVAILNLGAWIPTWWAVAPVQSTCTLLLHPQNSIPTLPPMGKFSWSPCDDELILLPWKHPFVCSQDREQKYTSKLHITSKIKPWTKHEPWLKSSSGNEGKLQTKEHFILI